MSDTRTVSKVVNGVPIEELVSKVKAVSADPELGAFRFRIVNKWRDCGYNETTVADFYGQRQVIPHRHPFTLTADEPPTLLGGDEGANPVEHLLHALASCLTTSLVYHAAVRGIHIEEVESTLEGKLDIRGFMGISDKVRKGYQNIRVAFRVKSDAPQEKLEECARFSPVLDVVMNGTQVDLAIATR